MKIGVDARPLCYPGTGIYRYTIEMLKRMTAIDCEWFLYSDRKYNEIELNKENIKHRVGNNRIANFSTFYAQLLFPHWARQDQIDVFWSPRHHLPLTLSSSISSVVTIHDLVWIHYGETMTRFGRLLESFLMPRAIKSADYVIAVSNWTGIDIKEHFPLAAHKTKVITGASCFPTPTPTPLHDTINSYFLFVGTLEPRKNLPLLLAAYKNYTEKHPEPIPLIIAGGAGWGNIAIKKLVAQHNLSNQVTLLGQVSEKQLADLYKNAHTLLMPSLYEGFGLPLVEAMSQGVPVITSNLSAMKEICGDGGILVDPSSITEMSEAMISITTDENIYKKLSISATLQSKKFCWDTSAARMLKILLSLSE